MKEFYEAMGVKKIETNFKINAQHAMITDDYGGSCTKLGSPWINNCDYSAAGSTLKTFYGDLKKPVQQIESNVCDQKIIFFFF